VPSESLASIDPSTRAQRAKRAGMANFRFSTASATATSFAAEFMSEDEAASHIDADLDGAALPMPA